MFRWENLHTISFTVSKSMAITIITLLEKFTKTFLSDAREILEVSTKFT